MFSNLFVSDTGFNYEQSYIYSNETQYLKEEKEKLKHHLKNYGDKYNLKEYEPIGSSLTNTVKISEIHYLLL